VSIYGDTAGWHCTDCGKRGMSEIDARTHGCAGPKPSEPSSAREWLIERARGDSLEDKCRDLERQLAEAWAEWESMNITAGMYSLEADRYREALERIGAIDMPSAADKTAWIVMLESVCLLARKTLKGES
jgi:hypothetical protein